jgi:hypothetical protein
MPDCRCISCEQCRGKTIRPQGCQCPADGAKAYGDGVQLIPDGLSYCAQFGTIGASTNTIARLDFEAARLFAPGQLCELF